MHVSNTIMVVENVKNVAIFSGQVRDSLHTSENQICDTKVCMIITSKFKLIFSLPLNEFELNL